MLVVSQYILLFVLVLGVLDRHKTAETIYPAYNPLHNLSTYYYCLPDVMYRPTN